MQIMKEKAGWRVGLLRFWVFVSLALFLYFSRYFFNYARQTA